MSAVENGDAGPRPAALLALSRMHFLQEEPDEQSCPRLAAKISPGPTYLYTVSRMLLYYLENPVLAVVAKRANVD